MLALTLHALFLALAFGLRTIVHFAQTGSMGLRAFSQERTAAGRLGVLLLVAGGTVSIIGSVGRVAPPKSGALDFRWLRWTGAAIACGAIAMILVAQFTMGRSWRIGVDPEEKTELVTGGLFACVRNPIFSGMLAFWCGIALVAPNVLTIAAPFVAWLGVELQVRGVEEPYLLRVHGAAYRAYAARTGRLLPGIGKISLLASERA